MRFLMTNPQPGTPVVIDGMQATTCIYGDGYGLHLVAAGPNTSCEFAKAVMGAQTSDLNASRQNVRDYLKPEVSVTSPVTGEEYTMRCVAEPTKLIRCTGGNDATVILY